MQRFAPRAGRARSARRRTVRIVKQRRATRTAAISLLIVAVPAMLLFVAWRFWQTDEEVPTFTRRLADVVLDWKCEGGHTFKARGQVAPRKCPTCGRAAYAVGTYHCPIHGPFELSIRYAEDSAGVARPSEYRIGRKWAPAADGAHCPRCGRNLERRPKDPFAPKPRGRQRDGH